MAVSRYFQHLSFPLCRRGILGEDTAGRAVYRARGVRTAPSDGRLVMRSSSLPMLRGAAWVYVGSLAAIGTVALFALCFSLLTMAVQLVAALLEQITTQL
jgi:hypothetical protein